MIQAKFRNERSTYQVEVCGKLEDGAEELMSSHAAVKGAEIN